MVLGSSLFTGVVLLKTKFMGGELNLKERSLVLVKPDAVVDGREKEIITFIKEKGMEIVLTERIECNSDKLKLLYPHVVLPNSISTMLENFKKGPAVLIIFEGEMAVEIGVYAKNIFRKKYNYGYYGCTIHASDDEKEFERELSILLQNLNIGGGSLKI